MIVVERVFEDDDLPELYIVFHVLFENKFRLGAGSFVFRANLPREVELGLSFVFGHEKGMDWM